MTETLANRRVFRSKVDSIRPTYGFEDVSLAPGTDTVDPADIVARPGLLRHPPRDTGARRGDGCRRRRPAVGRAGPARWPVDPQPRGRPVPLRRPVRGHRPGHRRPRRRRPGRPGGGLPGPDPRGAHRAPDRRAARRGLQGGPVGDAGHRPQVRPVLPPSTARTCSSSSRRSRRPATSPPGTSRSPCPSSRGSCRSPSPWATRPTPRPRSCSWSRAPRPSSSGSGRARRARRARCWASGSRRSPRSATWPPPATPTSPRPAATCRSSPTAA